MVVVDQLSALEPRENSAHLMSERNVRDEVGLDGEGVAEHKDLVQIKVLVDRCFQQCLQSIDAL